MFLSGGGLRLRLRVGMVVVWAGWLKRLEEGGRVSLSEGGSQSLAWGGWGAGRGAGVEAGRAGVVGGTGVEVGRAGVGGGAGVSLGAEGRGAGVTGGAVASPGVDEGGTLGVCLGLAMVPVSLGRLPPAPPLLSSLFL